MTSILFSGSEMQSLVICLELLIVGTVGLILVYLLTKKQPKQANRNIILYILMMSIIFYAIFYLKDPFEFLPQDFWNIANYIIIVGTIYGFYRQIIGGFRAEFNDRLDDFRGEVNKRLDDFKTDMCRDMDKIDKRLDRIEASIEKLRK